MTPIYSTRNPGPFGGPVQPNYPRNTWWVAGRVSDVGDKPWVIQMLDTPVVIFRRADGSLAALHDRCPHRWAPLSSGWVENGNIVCGYHGLAFDGHGRCVHVPSQDSIPAKAAVRSYPIQERHGLLWVWLGDEARAEGTQPPAELAFLMDPGWSVATGEMLLESNYMMLKENVLDLTHFGYVHRNSLKISDWRGPPKVEVGDTTVTYAQEFPSAPLAPPYAGPTGIGVERPVYRKSWGRYVSPALNLGAVDIRDPAPPAGARSEFSLRIVHLTTPISPTRTRYWYFLAWDIPGLTEWVQSVPAQAAQAFGEDAAIVAAVTRSLLDDASGCDYPEVLLQADQAAVQARRKLQALMELEQPAT